MTIALDGNNPGGMNDGDWAKKQPGYAGSNGRYASFKTLTDGVNAMAALLTSYIVRGYDTPRKVANRWAPVADGNDSAKYASILATRMGIDLDARIPASDAQRLAIIQASVENAKFPEAWAAEKLRVAMLATKKGAS